MPFHTDVGSTRRSVGGGFCSVTRVAIRCSTLDFFVPHPQFVAILDSYRPLDRFGITRRVAGI